MNRKRRSSEENGSNLKKCRKQKFTEVETVFNDETTDKYFDETLSDVYQPQFSNYQLIGDFVAGAILNSKDLIMRKRYYNCMKPITRQRFCDVAWSVHDLLLQLKSKKKRYPIAKKVILSVGYNDFCSNSMNAAMLIEYVEKIIKKLRRRGCRDIILTNVPPCGMACDNINHWKYLQIINEEILKLSEKHNFIKHCDIFRLFCKPKNLFTQNKDYVTYTGEINYKIDFVMYNEIGYNGDVDLITFSNLAKIVLGKHVMKTIEKRIDYLRHGTVNKVICVLELASDDNSDSDDDEVLIVKTENKDKCQESCVTINLDSSDEDDGGNFDSDCKCEIPQKDGQVKKEISSSIKKLDDIKDEKLSCEMSQEYGQMKQIILSSIIRLDDIKDEKPLCEVPQKGGQVKQEISSNIKKLDEIKDEKLSCEISPENGQVKPVILSSIIRLDDIKDEKPSCEILEEDGHMEKEILCSIKRLDDIKDEKPSCEIPEENEHMEKENLCSIKRLDDIKDEKPSCEIPEENEHMEKENLCSIKRLDDIKDEKLSCEIPEEDGYLEKEILCSIERLDDIKDEKPSDEIPEEDGFMEKEILCNIKRLDDIKDEKPSSM